MPDMGKQFQITLDGFDLGQALDGLRIRQESWANTAIFLRDGYISDDAFAAEECSDPDEAEKIADYYDRIVRTIEAQVHAQGGW